eukprot:872895_1
MVHYIDLLISYNKAAIESRQLFIQNKQMEQSTHPLTNFQPQRNKCKQLTIHLHKLLITLCGDTNTSSRRRFWYILLIFAISSYIMCIADVLTEYRWQKQPPLILP